jgi:hypothetical protein
MAENPLRMGSKKDNAAENPLRMGSKKDIRRR